MHELNDIVNGMAMTHMSAMADYASASYAAVKDMAQAAQYLVPLRYAAQVGIGWWLGKGDARRDEQEGRPPFLEGLLSRQGHIVAITSAKSLSRPMIFTTLFSGLLAYFNIIESGRPAIDAGLEAVLNVAPIYAFRRGPMERAYRWMRRDQ